MSHTRTINTGADISLRHGTTSRRDYDTEAHENTPAWDLVAHAEAKTNEIPDADDIDTIVKATYTEACLAMMPQLHSKQSAPQPLPVEAKLIGTYGDVAATELEKATEICERFNIKDTPLGAVAAIIALSPSIGNAEAIRPQLELIKFDVPSLAAQAAERIDDALATLDQDSDPVPPDDRNDPDWSDSDLLITTVAAHTIAMATKRHAIQYCATRMADARMPRYVCQAYQEVAELIINASTEHIGSTIGQLEMENQIASLHPEMARLMEDILTDAGDEHITEFHRACQQLDTRAETERT